MTDASFTTAMAAIHEGHAERVRELVTCDPALVDARSPETGGNLLHEAAYKNDVELCRFLVKAGCSTSQWRELDASPDKPHWGCGTQTPLALALEVKATDAAAYLAELEIAPDNLWMAASLGRMDRLRRFFDASGALLDDARDPNKAGDDSFVLTDAMVGAAHQGQLEAVSFLLERGAAVSGRNQFGMTALHYAAQGQKALTELLLDWGADVCVREWQYDATPYGWARYGDWPEIAALLEERCELDPRDRR